MLDVTNRKFLPPSVWTDERINALKTHWDNGLTAMQVANALGGFEHCADGGRSAVLGKVNRLGLETRAVDERQPHHKRRGPSPEERTRRAAAHRCAAEDRRKLQARKQEERKREKERKRLENGTLPPLKPKVAPVPVTFLALTFMEAAGNRLCMFPRGDGAEMRFCGQPQMKGQSWCPDCCGIVFNFMPQESRRSPAPANYLSGPGAGLKAFLA